MKNKAETLFKTDKAIFYYVWDQMMQQNAKSYDLYSDEDGDEVIGDNCQYFGYKAYDEPARCALGFIMNKAIADEYYVEENNAACESVLSVILESNPNWEMTNESVQMVILLQIIHDSLPVDTWNDAFSVFSVLFDADGNFESHKLLGKKIDNDEDTDQVHLPKRTFYYQPMTSCEVISYVTREVNKVRANLFPAEFSEAMVVNHKNDREKENV